MMQRMPCTILSIVKKTSQGSSKATRKRIVVSHRGYPSRSCTIHQKKETGSFKSFPPVWEPLDAHHHLVRTRHRYPENQQPLSSRYEIAREHHRCGIKGTLSRSWHLVPGFGGFEVCRDGLSF